MCRVRNRLTRDCDRSGALAGSVARGQLTRRLFGYVTRKDDHFRIGCELLRSDTPCLSWNVRIANAKCRQKLMRVRNVGSL